MSDSNQNRIGSIVCMHGVSPMSYHFSPLFDLKLQKTFALSRVAVLSLQETILKIEDIITFKKSNLTVFPFSLVNVKYEL